MTNQKLGKIIDIGVPIILAGLGYYGAESAGISGFVRDYESRVADARAYIKKALTNLRTIKLNEFPKIGRQQ